MASCRRGGDREGAEDRRDRELEEILALLPRADRERLRARLELTQRASILEEDRTFARPTSPRPAG